MPMKNFYSIRIFNPPKGKPVPVYRYGFDILGRGIDIVWLLKKEASGKVKTHIQAIRFDKRYFTQEKVKKWTQEHAMFIVKLMNKVL